MRSVKESLERSEEKSGALAFFARTPHRRLKLMQSQIHDSTIAQNLTPVGAGVARIREEAVRLKKVAEEDRKAMYLSPIRWYSACLSFICRSVSFSAHKKHEADLQRLLNGINFVCHSH